MSFFMITKEYDLFNLPEILYAGTDNITTGEISCFWDSINKKRGYGWSNNPWVWVYEFERIEL